MNYYEIENLPENARLVCKDNSICGKCINISDKCDITFNKKQCENFKCCDNKCSNCQFRIEDRDGYIDCIAEH